MLDFAFRAFLSIAVGGLIGLERERGRKTPILGMRTFALASFLGFLLSDYAKETPYGWIAALAGFVGVLVLAILYYYSRVHYSYYGQLSLGLTTTLVIPLAFFLGSLIAFDKFLEAGVAAIACVYLLVEKKELRELGETITKQELLDLLLFIVIAFIIYPQLPANPIDVLGYAFDARYFWFIVVIVSGISFCGHLLAKYYKKNAVFATAFLGGLVSSVATTVVFLKRTRDERVLYAAVASAALASTLSNAAVVLVANAVFLKAALPLVAALTLAYAAAAWLALQKIVRSEPVYIEKRALSIKFSLEFAVLFFLASLALDAFANSPGATIAVSFVGGILSSTSVYAAVAYAVSSGSLAVQPAVYALLFASLGSFATKTALTAVTVKKSGLTRKLALLGAAAFAAGATAAYAFI